MKIWMLTSTAVLAMSAGLAVSSPAHAQQAPDRAKPESASTAGKATSQTEQGIQDIIVTAARREQSLQKTAIPVTVITSQELKERGVTNVQELSKLAPALKIGPLGGGSLQITARGVGTFGGNTFSEPGVSINLDGAYISRTTGANGIFYDVSRVELLKGPQGTLYGRNSTGGVLNIITNDPTATFGGDFTGEVGSYGLARASGALNVPITDGVALRVAAQGLNRNGYLSDGYNDDKGFAARGKLKLDLVPHLSVLLEANYAVVKGKGYAGVFSPFIDPSNPYLGPSTTQSNATFNIPGIGPLLPRIKNDGFLNNHARGLKASVSYDFDWAKATLIVNNIRSTTNYLQYNNAFPVAEDTRSTPLYSTTAELRLGNNGAGRFKWVVGGFYYQDRNATNAVVNQGFTFADTRKLFLRTKSYSGFGEATFSITPGIRLTGGGRYTSDQKALDGTTLNPPLAPGAPCAAPSTAVVDPIRGAVCQTSDTGAQTFSKFTYKVGAEADIGSRSLVYATYATGFKSGGFFASANFAAPGAVPSNSYKPEELSAWTIGSKNRFFNNTLQINAEGFFWKYKDKQVSHLGFIPPNNLILLVDNAANATVYGAEIQALWQPTHHDNFAANLQYTHSIYDRYVYSAVVTGYAQAFPPGSPVPTPVTGCAFSPTTGIGGAPRGAGVPGLSTVDCSGRVLTLAPTWALNLSYRHVFDLPSGSTIVPSVSSSIQSGYWAGEEYYTGEYQASNTTTDFSLTWTTANKGFSLTGYVNNIEDSVVKQTSTLNGTLAKATTILRAPRTFGFRAGVHF